MIGYYPPHPSKEYTEYSAGGKGDYFAELCTDWESAAKLPAEVGVRQVTIRSGAESQRNHDIEFSINMFPIKFLQEWFLADEEG